MRHNQDTDKTTERQDKQRILPGIFAEGYGYVPKLLMKDHDLPVVAKAVLCYLASYAGIKSECWPSHTEIIENLGISKRTLTRAIKRAIGAGYISKTQRRERGKGTRNTYYLPHMDDFRSATRAPSKKKKVLSCPLEVPPEHPLYKYKQENKHYRRERAEKSPYPEFTERIDDER